MKKMQCEVCGGTEIKKVSDGIFECQSCGVQYDTTEVKKLLVEVTGKVKIDHSEEVENNIKRAEQYEQAGNDIKASEYYNAALDIDADNKVAQQRVKKIADQQELEDYYIIEPDVDPKENVRQFLEQLSATQNIACDIYKEIAIKSVTEKYMTFYFMKAQYRADWTATACYRYYENQTVYKERYNSQLKKYVKEPVTEKVERINRVPRNGTLPYSSEELVLASDNLEKLFVIDSETVKNSLIAAFEQQQDSKYSTYDVKKINTRNVQKENGNFMYKGLALDAKVDRRVYVDKKKRMSSEADAHATTEIKNSIGGDFWENFDATIGTVSESVAYVCIPVQIIEYTYKGKAYAALSDLLSYTTTMPVIYPCDQELATAKDQLKNQKAKAVKTPGLLTTGFVLLGITLLVFAFGSLFSIQDDTFLITLLTGLVLSLVFMLIGCIIQSTRKKAFQNAASEAKKKLHIPRHEALRRTMESFFAEYTDYASAKTAAANTDCIAIKDTFPALSSAGPLMENTTFNNTDKDEDEIAAALEYGIAQQKKRNVRTLLLMIGGGFLIMMLGILVIIQLEGEGVLFSVLGGIMLLGGFAMMIIVGPILSSKICNRLRRLQACRTAYIAGWISDEQGKAPAISKEAVMEEVKKINEGKEQEKVKSAISIKTRLLSWIKAHKVLVIAAGSILLLITAVLILISIISNAQAKPYEEGLVGRTFEFQEVDHRKDLITHTYQFGENGESEYTQTTTDAETSELSDNYSYVAEYCILYDIFTGKIALDLNGTMCEAICYSGSTRISYFTKNGDVYYEVTDSEKDSDASSYYEGNSTPSDGSSNGSPSGNNSVSDDGNIAEKAEPSFKEALEFSKYWSMEWTDSSGIKYIVYYGFEDSGTCYMIMSAGYEIVAEGIGSFYTDGNTVVFNIVINGDELQYTYMYDAESSTFTQMSDRGLAYDHAFGDCFSIEVAEITGASKLQEIFGSDMTFEDSNSFGDSSPSDSSSTPDDSNSFGNGDASDSGTSSQQPTVCSHNYSDATCTKPKTCTLCGEATGSALGHTYSAATCNSPQTCSVCGATEGSAAGHDWAEITETVYHEEQGHYHHSASEPRCGGAGQSQSV